MVHYLSILDPIMRRLSTRERYEICRQEGCLCLNDFNFSIKWQGYVKFVSKKVAYVFMIPTPQYSGRGV